MSTHLSPLSGFSFVGEPLERADALRADPDALARLWPDARLLVLDRDGTAFTGADDQPLPLTGAAVGGGPGTAVFLGLRGEQAWFSVEASVLDVAAPGRMDLRQAALSWSVASSSVRWGSRSSGPLASTSPWRSRPGS